MTLNYFVLIQILLAIFTGILAGTFTGLIPGIHINLIGTYVAAISAKLIFHINPLYIIIFIAAMAITHTFIDFIPSVFLGCPDTDTELSVLPSHKLLIQGRGFEAIILANYGSIIAIIILIFISTPLAIFTKQIYEIIYPIIPYLLITVSLSIILLEKRKFKALKIFIMTGALGLITANVGMEQSLLPLLTGLFGSSMLILSVKNKTRIPKQEIFFPKTKLKKPILASSIAAPICSFLPGLGTAQSVIISSSIFKIKKEEFITLTGITNTLVMAVSFISIFTISKTRTGAALAIKNILPNFSYKILILLMIVSVITGIIAFFLTILLSIFISKKINKINYTYLSIATLALLTLTVFLITGFAGILIFLISTAMGIYAARQKVKRTNMMGCLILPTILFYLL